VRAAIASLRLVCGLALCLWAAAPGICADAPKQSDWPMLAHDPARSGATASEIRPPFERKWYRLFGDEGLMAGVQPVISGGKVFVGTMAGVLHAIDSQTGQDVWTFKAGGAILHACAAHGQRVFFGSADGKVYAVDAADGKPLWSLTTHAAIWNSPVVYDNTVVIGSRDGKLYAIEAESGRLRWTAATGGPLLCSPAYDSKTGHVYMGSEDMHVYAFHSHTGARIWRSEKLPGVSFRGYHPVVAPDGSIMITVAPAFSADAIEPVLLAMVKEIFGDFASWRHNKEENARLREANFKLMENPQTYEEQLACIRKRLTEQPAFQTFFVLDPKTGKQKFVAPIVYAESMNGTGAPAIVTPDGKVIVKYQALLRSRYEHYSPFLNVGYLDTATGHIRPIMDQSRTYGWHDSLLLVHDEQCQLSVAGRVLINTHQDNVNALDLDTLKGYGEPFCRNIHEPQPGEALGIWAHVLRGQPLPVGKEWLARGTAVYGGGSVLDVPVAIAGDSFYYIPAHEINAGAAVIAYRVQPGGIAARQAPPPDGKLNDDEWQKVQQLPWDWDTLRMSRLDNVLKALPGKVPGTFDRPLTEEAGAAVVKITDAELDRFVWEAPALAMPAEDMPAEGARKELVEELSRQVRELISQQWRPLMFPAGKHPGEAYRFFVEPTETLEVLARAYLHLDADLQQQVKEYVTKMASAGGPLEAGTGLRVFPAEQGENRAFYDAPPPQLMRSTDDITRSELARLYPLWLWAYRTGDWRKIERGWKQLRELAGRAPNKLEEDCRNGHVAGLIAYCRIAKHMKDDAAVEQALPQVRSAMRERLAYELAYTRGGLITQVPVGRSIFARWRHLTPELGRLCAAYAGKTHQHLVQVYVDYHRPTWPLAWNVETMMRNECPLQLPTMPAEVFAARALILGEPAEKLRGFLDLPWCKADLFYIQKLVYCIEAGGKATWQDVRSIQGDN